MEQLILLIISFCLGLWQGLKKRNKKNQKKINDLQSELALAKDKIQKLERINRIEQYSNNSTVKAKREKLETDLMTYITSSNQNYKYLLHTSTLLDFIFEINDSNDIIGHYINSRELLAIVDDYIKQEPIDIIVTYKNTKKFVNCNILFDDFKSFLYDFNIDEYLVTNSEFLEVSKFILFDFE
ncbi:hypothetical protein [Thomasclavelia cocleata]|uniref:hypothetical protein n=1 Tax=Thomasclavelia cocleata TaxID=69824 RepID=UPI00255AE9D4|nr:hypothetical protein [Thomasclavelia cocleata]